MRREEIYQVLAEIIKDVIDNNDLTILPSTVANDVSGWDSIKMVMIIVEVQERFGIKLRSRDVDSLNCVEDLVLAIESKLV